MTRCDTEEMKVVSLATGSKCLDQDNLSDKGASVTDSHAEVLARRGLVRLNINKTRSRETCFTNFFKPVFFKLGFASHVQNFIEILQKYDFLNIKFYVK